MQEKRVVRVAEVLRRTGMSRRSLYQEMAADRFPKNFKIGPRAMGWWDHEVAGWLATRGGQG